MKDYGVGYTLDKRIAKSYANRFDNFGKDSVEVELANIFISKFNQISQQENFKLGQSKDKYLPYYFEKEIGF